MHAAVTLDSRNDRRLVDGLALPISPTVRSQLESLPESEWNGLVASSCKHGIAPLLYHRLTSGSSPVTMPENVLRTLREIYLGNGVRNGLLYLDLSKVLQALQQADIPVIVLKGACLAELVYGDPALRQMGDIDLLVRKADLARTADRLHALGYDCKNRDIEKWCRIYHHLPAFTKPPHPRVEVHWTILRPTFQVQPDLDGLWARARRASIAGTEALVLSPADLLLHLCAHAGGQEMGPFSLGVRPLSDIAAVIEHYHGEIDWREVGCRAREWRADRCVFLALLLAKTMVAASVPEDFLQTLRPEDFDDNWLATAQIIVLIGEADPAMRPVKVFADHCATASLLGKAGFVLRKAFPSREFMAGYMDEHYSMPLTPIRRFTSYWTRGIDLMGKGIRLGWHWRTQRHETNQQVQKLRQAVYLQRWLDVDNPRP